MKVIVLYITMMVVLAVGVFSTKVNTRKIEEEFKMTSNLDAIAQEAIAIVQKELETTKIEDVKISIDMDLTERTGLSRNDFIELLSGLRHDSSGFFRDNAGTIYDVCEEFSINEIFFCGLIAEESGWNIAANHRRTNNFISLMSNGRLLSYSSVEEGLRVAAQKLHDNYLSTTGKFYHGTTLSGVKVCFCPASSTWTGAVFGRMQSVLR